ncbi:MAG: Gfo/Idh/MocA family protein [Spirochaetia bacterium]
MAVRFAFAGFRHVHIYDLYRAVESRQDTELASAAEDHSATADKLKQENINLTHNSVEELIQDTGAYDVLAIGDYYGRRGELAIKALTLGKPVIADKPLCTSLEELEQIKDLSRKKGLPVGCMLNMGDQPQIRKMGEIIKAGDLGTVRTITFHGQHPLLYGTRPSWYFEKGKHGGTINDIAIHAVDVLPRLLGTRFSRIIAARVWNDRLAECPEFEVGAQVMLSMENGIGVIGDVSYLSPDSQGYTVPQYWRYTVHGDNGLLETSKTAEEVALWLDGDTGRKDVPLGPERTDGYLDDFLAEVNGTGKGELQTEGILESTRITLLTQEAAREGSCYLDI